MGTAPRTVFIDQSGQPLSERIQHVLRELTPRLRRQFPTLRDDVVITEILEEAGRRILDRERQVGPVQRLRGYAWVSIRHLATSHLRLSSMRLQQQTLSGANGMAAIAELPATTASVHRIEHHLLFKEVLALLSEEEQKVCLWKNMGFSSREIARHRGNSTEAVDTMFFARSAGCGRPSDSGRRSDGLRPPVLRRARSAASQMIRTCGCR